jgi:hypothetical protein
MNRAFDAHSRRAEPIYFMCKWFREHGQNHKAYHYYLKGKNIPYPKDDVLFVEDAVYSGIFKYGNTILACYVNDKSCLDSLCDVISYLNRGVPHRVSNVWDDMHYYREPLNSRTYKGTFKALEIKEHEQYKVSTCSLIPFSDEPA